MSNKTTNVTTTVVGRVLSQDTIIDELILPSFGILFGVMSLLLNSLSVYTFMKNKALKSKDGLFFMMLLSIMDCVSALFYSLLSAYNIINIITPLQLTIKYCFCIVSLLSCVIWILHLLSSFCPLSCGMFRISEKFPNKKSSNDIQACFVTHP
jgi:hypothetical protein